MVRLSKEVGNFSPSRVREVSEDSYWLNIVIGFKAYTPSAQKGDVSQGNLGWITLGVNISEGAQAESPGVKPGLENLLLHWMRWEGFNSFRREWSQNRWKSPSLFKALP